MGTNPVQRLLYGTQGICRKAVGGMPKIGNGSAAQQLSLATRPCVQLGPLFGVKVGGGVHGAVLIKWVWTELY